MTGYDTPPSTARIVVHNSGTPIEWTTTPARIPFDDTAGSPWILAPPTVRDAFDAVSNAGRMLADTAFGRPRLGVKTGCNEAFVVTQRTASHALANDLTEIASGHRTGAVESKLLRPVTRGEHLAAWTRRDTDERILWTHGADGQPLKGLPRHALGWLRQWQRVLETRADTHGAKWWTLFRTESANRDRPRVAWADIGLSPRATVFPAGDSSVPLNTCYVVSCPRACDAYALATLLNSSLISAWLSLVAEPARGGYHRYLGWTMALVPVPREWDRAASILAPIGERALAGFAPPADSLAAAILDAFRLESSDVAPLIRWNSRHGGQHADRPGD